jgi:hypothetical protein
MAPFAILEVTLLSGWWRLGRRGMWPWRYEITDEGIGIGLGQTDTNVAWSAITGIQAAATCGSSRW